MPLLCDHTLATQQRQVSYHSREEGSLLASAWSCHQEETRSQHLLLPSQEELDPVPSPVLEVPGVRLLSLIPHELNPSSSGIDPSWTSKGVLGDCFKNEVQG